MRIAAFAGIAFTATLLAAPLQAQVIDTRTAGTETTVFGGSGIYGQTFSPTGPFTQLDSFSFWVGDYSSSNVTFKAYVYAFDGSNSLTGSSLYESGLFTTAGLQPQRFDFSTGGIGLTPGQQYMALIENQTLGQGLYMGFIYPNSSFTGGAAKYSNSLRVIGSPEASGYFDLFTNGDMKFVANFSDPGSVPVPEPGAALLLVIAAMGLGARVVVGRRAAHTARA